MNLAKNELKKNSNSSIKIFTNMTKYLITDKS